MKRILAIIALVSTVSACEKIAVMSTPPKHAAASQSALADKAEQYFWNTLHGGHYDNIHHSLYLLTAAYLKNPHDPNIAAHIGFLHIWKIAERARLLHNSPLITDHIVLSQFYFSEAQTLDPQNPIYLGFLGDAQLIQGQIFQDKRTQVRGYFALKRAIKAWPEFNYFTAGYPMSSLRRSSKEFKEGLVWQWKTLDRCAGTRVSRSNPDFAPFMHLETRFGDKRACWNSWAAPFNFEGFFMNMGDMLVKAQEGQKALIIYHNAQLASNYQHWPYKAILEEKMQAIESNRHLFQKESKDPTHRMMFSSAYACMACHQRA